MWRKTAARAVVVSPGDKPGGDALGEGAVQGVLGCLLSRHPFTLDQITSSLIRSWGAVGRGRGGDVVPTPTTRTTTCLFYSPAIVATRRNVSLLIAGFATNSGILRDVLKISITAVRLYSNPVHRNQFRTYPSYFYVDVPILCTHAFQRKQLQVLSSAHVSYQGVGDADSVECKALRGTQS